MWQIKSSLESWTAIAAVAFGTCASDGVNQAIWRDFADTLSSVFTEIQGSIRSASQAKGIIDLGQRCWPPITRGSLLTGACKVADLPFGSG
jgi:hypothetical protein